jgi:molybdopterin-guanine dinucleotide biosynthesis protein A
MGHDKAWLPFGPGETMLERVVRLVSEVVPADRIVCVAAEGQKIPCLPGWVRLVRDREPYLGPLSGLGTGLSVLERDADAVFVTGCDVPLLVPAVVARLFDLLGEDEIAVPHDGERYHPLAAVYRTSVRSYAESLLAAGERSLVSLIERCRSRTVPLDALRDIDPNLSSLANCNTPDDYQLALLACGFPT